MEARTRGNAWGQGSTLAAALFLAACGALTNRGDTVKESHVSPALAVEGPAPQARRYLDVHELGPGNVRAEDVAVAHLQDLATQGEFGVSFLEYWVDEASGRVYCLSEAPDGEAVVATHAKAHGLLPVTVSEVLRGE